MRLLVLLVLAAAPAPALAPFDSRLAALAQDKQDKPARTADVRRAKRYLADVRKHLLESYVDRDRLKGEDLDRAAARGLSAAADRKEYAEKAAALKDALKDKSDPAAALDAAAAAVGDAPFDWLRFADHGATAMLKHAKDPFARILSREDFDKLLRMLQGGDRDRSIGLSVEPRDGGFSVFYVQYGYPAYDEGLEMGDEIIELDGKPVAGRSPEEVNEQMLLKPGEEIRIKVRRAGHRDPYEFHIVQRKAKPKDVHYAMLGDGVGYVRLTLFDLGAAGQVERALRALRKEGMTALVFDLRHNPGGALQAATAVADLFIPGDVLITRVDMSYKPTLFGIKIPGLGQDGEHRSSKTTDFETLPMRVLINGASASASELVSGALQDHRRAVVIGQTTFGKGVGQAPIPLTGAGGGFLPNRFLYLTVLRYYLPTGRSIDHKGVEPDVRYGARAPAADKFAELWGVRTSKTLSDYLGARWNDDFDVFRRLAEYDAFETARYPDFDKLYADLKTAATRDEVRQELRRAVRKRLAEREDAAFVCDLETDLQLQYALVDLLDSRK